MTDQNQQSSHRPRPDVEPIRTLIPANPSFRGRGSHGPSMRRRHDGHALKLVRSTCLVVPLGGDRPLARAFVELLREELPSFEPTLDERARGVDVIWACGYRAGAGSEVARLRALHPDALLVVSGRSLSLSPAKDQLRQVGADRVVAWPAPISELRDALGSQRVRA